MRAARAGIAVVVLVAGSLAGLPPASAIPPPMIDPAAVPPDGPPGPLMPMKQNAYCTEVGVLPGTDFGVPPKYMDMLNLAEAWRFGRGAGVKVAVIDTGVTPHPRLPRLIDGGDYVMGGDGLSDCDAHGTIVASMIGAIPAGGPPPLPAPPRRPVTVPTVEPPPPPPPVPPAPPPQTVTLSPLPQTVTVVPPPPPAELPPAGAAEVPPPGQLPAPDAATPGPQPAAGPPGAPESAAAVMVPSRYSGGGHIVAIDLPRDDPPPPVPDAYSGIAPDVEIIAIRQSSRAFGPRDAYGSDEDPQTREKIDYVETMARAVVHAADMGASVINISDVLCMSARSVVDQRSLGAAVRYAAVEKNAVIVAAAGDTSKKDCRQNPVFDPLRPDDPRDWNDVNSVVTPSWFSDYVLTVGAVDLAGRPLTQGGPGQASTSVAGPWVSVAAPGVDVVGLSPRDDSLVNAIDGPDNTQLLPAGTSFSAAIVSGVAALVRARFPQLSAHQVIHRLTRTARGPARGLDNQVGYGVIDPVAALSWDVPEGTPLPAERLSGPLATPEPPPARDMRPVWIAGGGLAAVLLVGAALLGGPALARRSKR